MLLLVTGALSYFLLGLDVPDPVGKTTEWLVWRGAASLGVGLAAMLFFRAVVALWHLPPAPAHSTKTAAIRPSLLAWIRKGRDDENKRPVIGYLVLSGLLVASALVFLAVSVESPRVWTTIPQMDVRLTGVSVSVAVLAIPWIALLLLSENTLRRWRHHLPCKICRARGTSDDLKVGAYLQVWDLITHCLLAFGAFVVIALLPTGALRALWLATEQEPDKFPATDVLLYGAFFATILGVVALPVLASWRATSWRIVDAKVPLTKLSDVNGIWVEERQRLIEVLHLDQGLLRNPLTIFSVFLPLVTATLAAFLPQLAKG